MGRGQELIGKDRRAGGQGKGEREKGFVSQKGNQGEEEGEEVLELRRLRDRNLPMRE